MLLSIVKHIVKGFVSVDKLANHQSSVFPNPGASFELFSFVRSILICFCNHSSFVEHRSPSVSYCFLMGCEFDAKDG